MFFTENEALQAANGAIPPNRRQPFGIAAEYKAAV